MRVFIQLLLCLVLFWPGVLLATPTKVVDLLNLPSMKTNRLAQNAMMDVALAGERVVTVGAAPDQPKKSGAITHDSVQVQPPSVLRYS